MSRLHLIAGALAIFAMSAPAMAAQERIVMRRPLDPAPNTGGNNGNPPPPANCGGPGNPCPQQCTYWDPRWVLPVGDPSVCVGQSVSSTAVCKAFTSANRDTPPVTVPDSVCEEDEASYRARCGGR